MERFSQMDGKDAIIARITEEAEKTAASLIRDAENERAEAEKTASISLDRELAQKKAALEDECGRIVSRTITLAGLDARKLILLEKQSALNGAYRKAEDTVAGDKKRYAELMAALTVKYAEDGDELIVGTADKTLLDKKWFSELEKRLKVKIVYSGDSHESRGVMLKGKESDKNLTLPAVMRELRERTESRAAQILFGDN